MYKRQARCRVVLGRAVAVHFQNSSFLISLQKNSESSNAVSYTHLAGAAQHPSNGTSRSDLRIQVTEILHQIGVPAHIKGYHYLRDSIIMAIEDPEIINAVTKQLYPSVAKQYETCLLYTSIIHAISRG